MEIKEQVTCFLGIHLSVDGTSEQAIKDWDTIFAKIIEIFNNSPLGQCSGTLMQLVDLFVKLLGMHSDHCSKEKKDFKQLQKKKKNAVEQILGENKILELSNELLPWFFEANDEMIKAAGGKDKYESLCQEEKDVLHSAMMQKLIIRLGQDAYEEMCTYSSTFENSDLCIFWWCRRNFEAEFAPMGVSPTQHIVGSTK